MKLPFLLSIGALLTLSQNTEATDVCASELLGTNDSAAKFCPKDCKNAGGTWDKPFPWAGTSSMDCSGMPSNSPNHNTRRGSICGCTFTGCTDVEISYTGKDDPVAPTNWTADAWYTPCGAKKEAALPFYARKWTGNLVKVAKGTRVRIGLMASNFTYVDKVVLEDHLYVVCGGTAGGGDVRSHCEAVNSLPPLMKCTELTIDYDPKTTVSASINYTPCGALPDADEAHTVAHDKLSISVQSGTNVSIGPINMPFETYIKQIMSGPKVNVLCSGIFGKNGNCKIVP